VIVSLQNSDVALEIVDLETQRDRQRTRLENLQRSRLVDPEAGDQIGVAATALAAIETRLAQLTKDAERLQLSATQAGTVLPPPATSDGVAQRMELRGWTGHPLDQANQGSLLETGTLVCLVADARLSTATLLVEQNDIEFVRVGDEVELQFDQFKGRVISGVVESIARTGTELVTPQLVASGQAATKQDDSGGLRPTVTSYEATVTLSGFDSPAIVRGSGRARVLAQPRSLGQRFGRYLARTFRWEW
jgi:hypothetical protein